MRKSEDLAKTRRRILLGLGYAVLTPGLASAQPARRTVRVGWLAGVPLPQGGDDYLDAFLEGMRELGYFEGKNLVIERMYMEYGSAPFDIFARLKAQTEQLAEIPVDAIVARHTITADGAVRASHSVPIVMASAANPVAVGLIDSLSRPGRNVTGLTLNTADITQKRLQLLKEIMPDVGKIGLVYAMIGKDYPVTKAWLSDCDRAAGPLGITYETVDLPGIDTSRWDTIFERAAAGGLKAMYISEAPFYLQRHGLLSQLSAKHRIACMGFSPEFARSGCLIAYGADVNDMFRRAAGFVDKIVKGADPSILPVEQPSKYVLAVNTKAADALGLVIPRSILARASEIIE